MKSNDHSMKLVNLYTKFYNHNQALQTIIDSQASIVTSAAENEIKKKNLLAEIDDLKKEFVLYSCLATYSFNLVLRLGAAKADFKSLESDLADKEKTSECLKEK